MQNPGRFLAGIAALIRNASGEYLLLKRSGSRDFGADAWECVTGRVNQGESFEEALHREVLEESGLSVRVTALIGLSHFYRGDRVVENELQGVVFACVPVGDATIRHSNEHSEYLWLAADDARELLTATDPTTQWLRRTIERAETFYSGGIDGLYSDGVMID
ncbi:MAG: hypothetical protein CME19_04900 [Gemmatimonadetes bacterium]|nr:hypothetical protein [Gemmatimonadota bacterium]|tara:strand:- start:377 stop:862 length:486 start_codon:yes stop_codon:yes gene_type:complete